MKTMETKEIYLLLQRYFEGETTDTEEQKLNEFFQSEAIPEELKEYAGYFNGLAEISTSPRNRDFEEEVMDFILENEHQDKKRFRKLWLNVTGIAASVIIVLGGFLFYQQQQKPFKDTFENPDQAYAYAQETLQFVSGKYNKGLASLSNFEKLGAGTEQIKKGVTPVNEFFERIERMENVN